MQNLRETNGGGIYGTIPSTVTGLQGFNFVACNLMERLRLSHSKSADDLLQYDQ